MLHFHFQTTVTAKGHEENEGKGIPNTPMLKARKGFSYLSAIQKTPF